MRAVRFSILDFFGELDGLHDRRRDLE